MWAFTTPEFWQNRLRKTGFISAISGNSGMNNKKEVLKKCVWGKVLDLGCGYGRLVDVLPSEVTEYTGIDITPEFIDEAHRKYPKKRFILADFLNNDFKDNEFDWVISVGVLNDEIGAIEGQEFNNCLLEEAKRVAKRIIVFPSHDPNPHKILCE